MESYTHHDPRIVPRPPRLHWGIVLALQIVTLGIFGLVWLVVQAVWVKRMTGQSKGLTWAIINLCAFPVIVTLASLLGSSAGLERLLFFVLNVTTVFTLRSQMEDFPINLSLGGGMTFLFGTIYFQYQLQDYSMPDPDDVFGPFPESPAYLPPTSPEPTP